MEPSDWSRTENGAFWLVQTPDTSHCTAYPLSSSSYQQSADQISPELENLWAAYPSHCIVDKKMILSGFCRSSREPDLRRDKLMGVVEKGEWKAKMMQCGQFRNGRDSSSEKLQQVNCVDSLSISSIWWFWWKKCKCKSKYDAMWTIP